MSTYFSLTKFGIGIFVVLSGLVGYAVSYPLGQPLQMWHPLTFMLGIYLLCSGSFALNQSQEWRQDKKMPRTANRPVASGKIKAWQGYLLGTSLIVLGSLLLIKVSPEAGLWGLCTVFLYNVVYTCYWKRRWAFGAVPGAIPGALPVVIGYAANTPNVWTLDSLYLFAIMFLWQMPHFWAIAIRYREDYKKGGFPVLPIQIGVPRTVYHIGLYTFFYIALALALPFFFEANFLYILLVVPICIKLLIEFFKYQKASNNWLPFFLWVNSSLLVFIGVPVFDKWVFYLLGQG